MMMMMSKQTKTDRGDDGVAATEPVPISAEQWERHGRLIRTICDGLLELKSCGYQDLTASLIDDLGWVMEDEHRLIGERMGFSKSPPAEAEEAETEKPEVDPSPSPAREAAGAVDPGLEWFEGILKQPRRPTTRSSRQPSVAKTRRR